MTAESHKDGQRRFKDHVGKKGAIRVSVMDGRERG